MATEKRLIDANEYPCNGCEISYCYKNCSRFNAWLGKTEDAVPVVRCKDCRFWHKDTVSCEFVTADTNWYEEDFCSYGERKDYEG